MIMAMEELYFRVNALINPTISSTNAQGNAAANRVAMAKQEISNIRQSIAERQLSAAAVRSNGGRVNRPDFSSERARISILNESVRADMEFVKAQQKVNREVTRFKGENLSLMFIMIGIGAVIKSFLSPAAEAAGIFEIIGAILEILFLPAMILLIDPLIAVLDAVSALPEPVKEAAGILALIIGVGAALIGIATQFGLLTSTSIPGLIGALGSAIIGGITTAISGVLSAIAAFGAPLVAAILLLIVPLLTNFEGFVKIFVDLFRDTLNLIWSVVKTGLDLVFGLFDVFVKLFQGKWGEALDSLINTILTFFSNVSNIFANQFTLVKNLVFNFFGWFVEGWLRFVDNILTTVIGPNSFIQRIKDGLNTFVGWVSGIVDKIISFARNPIDSVRSLIPFAEGGIVTRPTPALVGEAGPEAIIPLSRMSSGLGTTVFNITFDRPVIREEEDIDRIASRVQEISANEYARKGGGF